MLVHQLAAVHHHAVGRHKVQPSDACISQGQVHGAHVSNRKNLQRSRILTLVLPLFAAYFLSKYCELPAIYQSLRSTVSYTAHINHGKHHKHVDMALRQALGPTRRALLPVGKRCFQDLPRTVCWVKHQEAKSPEDRVGAAQSRYNNRVLTDCNVCISFSS